MSIKTNVGELKPQEIKSFPKLMIGEDKIIILAINSTTKGITGVVLINDNSGANPVGFFNPKNFTDYNEPITITIQNR